MKVITNNQERQFVYVYDVPDTVLADQFEHLKDDDGYYDSDGYFKYRNYWYHITDFMNLDVYAKDAQPQFIPWDGYSSDSFFSGVVIKIASDCESYKVGTYIS